MTRSAVAAQVTPAMHCPAYVTNQKLKDWVAEVAQLTKPERIYWCDGSQAEYEALVKGMVQSGVMIPLNSKLRPRSYLTRTDPADVARSESSTYICSRHQIDAG